LHEFAHSIGFATLTNRATGEFVFGLPSVFDLFVHDNSIGLNWAQMTAAQRAESAVSPRNLVWAGANVTSALPTVLEPSERALRVLTPAAVEGDYSIGTASFGPSLDSIDLTRIVVPVFQNGELGRACKPLSARNKRLVSNKFALVERGGCGARKKARNIQAAGGAGVIVVHDVAGEPPPDLVGSSTNIDIPSVTISAADGLALLEQIDPANPGQSPVSARMFADASQFAGTDDSGRIFMYTPATLNFDLSVWHWDTSAAPALLMQPPLDPEVGHSLIPPNDLTFRALQDLGW
jgi:hypothetical protein